MVIPSVSYFMRISSKKGDKGITSDFRGQDCGKDFPVIQVLGDLDEANSFLGAAVVVNHSIRVKKLLVEIQNDLFLLGTVIGGATAKFPQKIIRKLNKNINLLEKNLPKLTAFIIPGGSLEASYLHIIRSIIRRVERKTYTYSKTTDLDKNVLVYLNRLSNLLFLLAREVNYSYGILEKEWKK